ERDIDMLKANETFQGMYKYSELFYEKTYSLLDYLSDDTLVIVDDMNRVQEAANNLDKEEAEVKEIMLEERQLLPHTSFSFDWLAIKNKLTQQRISLSVFLRHIADTQTQTIVKQPSRAMQEFHGQMNQIKNERNRWKEAKYSTIVVANNNQRTGKSRSI